VGSSHSSTAGRLIMATPTLVRLASPPLMPRRIVLPMRVCWQSSRPSLRAVCDGELGLLLVGAGRCAFKVRQVTCAGRGYHADA